MSETPGVPAPVRVLAERRAEARRRGDFGAADALRDEIASHGWQVRDTPDGWALTPAPPYAVAPTVAHLPDRSEAPDTRRATVALLVEGWPDDLVRCVESVLAHAPADVVVAGLDLGNVDGAGDALHALATAHPHRVEAWHVESHPGWGPARTALLRADTATVHVLAETSTVLDGNALSPLLDAVAEPGVVAAGWQGVDVDLGDAWRSVHPAGPGEVDAVLGYLAAVRRDAALAAGGIAPQARGYRNADLEMCLVLREAGGRVVVPSADLPCHAERHRGFHDTDPVARDREARRTYERLLRRFRGRVDILAPRGS